ncbi:hypothetical protein E8E15_006283 [Penicillium rubens]|uniref:Acetyltransferase n=1 Tax=Penicillium chrysogenum TaxID=5076 RepID=A0A169X2Z9_PENCH|nr:uncharacterized protein N7525_004096 [Penicillium rubens]KZN90416.1 hypothetical protein EN45_005330 [Penicillium chrysogenum]KAF3018006.1 hypothetical protein E8E15_006283 [Penicillium rubens]KAJ5045098.1 hypothetical protein NUH16_001910 [Penicillium rubens]KAJ5838908.1 hypothetical protein N7525_004096 [Penicillium rubens]KAJ5866958.1 hypothetical protein N7534_001511 [Penicillium rubens]
MGLFSSTQPPQPTTVPSDEIIPLHFWNTALCMRGTVLDVSLKFDDVLDVSKLRDALNRLLEMEDWRQLGARLRMNRDGKLEYHIPAHFDASRPAFSMTNAQHETSIADHPLGARIPHTTGTPAIFPSPDELSPLLRSADAPKHIDDWTYSDRPQLCIHVITFSDATVITITWLHTLADVMGMTTILNAWTALLQGNREAIPKLQGFRSDPLTQLGQRTPAEKYMHFNRVFGRKEFLWFIGLNIFDRLWYRQEERRTICIPATCLRSLRQQASSEISATSSSEGGTVPFVSESDVLLGWWVRSLYGALGLRTDQTILVNNALNLRTSLHESFMSKDSAYMGNALCMSPTFLQGQQIADEPLGQIALRIRESVAEQRTPEQVEAMTALQMQTMEKTGYLALVGDPRMMLLSCSNWHKARLFDMDFSPAVLQSSAQSSSQNTQKKGKPSYVNGVQHSENSFRNVLSVIGKDAGRNWWLTGVLRTDAWAHVEEQVHKLGSS